MASGMKMFGRVFVFGGVATTHVPAGQAHAQVYPAVAHFQTFFTAGGVGGDIPYRIKMGALRNHGLFLNVWTALHAMLHFFTASCNRAVDDGY
jgi:hypothetical protein